MSPKIVDLFCGIGGLGLGAARAGFQLALSVDNDAKLLEIHKTNFPTSGHLNADVATLNGAQMLAASNIQAGELVGVIGGSPCQGFSWIGKRNLRDRRNELFKHFFRLVSETNPVFFVAENVRGILDAQNRCLVEQGLALVRGTYELLEPFVLDAADFGAATCRERVFFVGFLPNRFDNLTAKELDSEKWNRRTTVGTALIGLPLKLRPSWSCDVRGWRRLRSKHRGRFWDGIFGQRPADVGDHDVARMLSRDHLVSGCIGTIHSPAVVKRFSKVPEGGIDSVSRMPRLDRSGLCPTLRAGTGPDRGSFQALRPIHFSEPRVITPREAARLQGFPDWFRLGATKWHAFRGIGNSVSPFVARALFDVLARKLK